MRIFARFTVDDVTRAELMPGSMCTPEQGPQYKTAYPNTVLIV